MSKKSRKHGKRIARTEKPVFTLTKNPLSGIDPEAIKSALIAMGAKKREEYPVLLNKLLDTLKAKSAVHILSILAGWGLQVGVSKQGTADHSMISKVEQHHVEFVQALALTLPKACWVQEPASNDDMQIIIDTAVDLSHAFHQRRYLAMEQERDEQARSVLSLQERIRMHTQMVRNWGYFSDVVQISTELYGPLDDAFRKALEFGATDLIAVASYLTSTVEQRATERFKQLKRIFRERKIKPMVRRYFKDYPFAKGDPEEFIRQIPSWVTPEAVVARLISMADVFLPLVFLMSPETIAKDLSMSRDIVQKIMDALSMQPGDLKGHEIDHFFMTNPIWIKPLVCIDDTYLCLMPQAIFSHIHDVMHHLANTAGLQKELEKRRAAFLEDAVGRLLVKALPTATIRHGVKWRWRNADYETDHLAMIDRTVVIIEDKSAALTGSGLRGAPDRVKRHVKELVVDPAEQSARLETVIRNAQANDSNAISALQPFGMSFEGVERIVRVSVTLDDFSILSSAEQELREAGWVPEGLTLPPTLNIADFKCMIDVLESQAFIIHYLLERDRIQESLHIFADELDFLGCYLETLFNIWRVEEEKPRLVLTGMSRSLDHYYTSLDAGVEVPKPKPKLRPYFLQLIKRMEERAFPNWLLASTELLRAADYAEQQILEKMLLELKRKVEKNWRDPNHECSILLTPPEIRETAFMFYLFPPQLASKRKDVAQQLATKALQESGRKRCILFGLNLSLWDLTPYSLVLFATPDQLTEDTL